MKRTRNIFAILLVVLFLGSHVLVLAKPETKLSGQSPMSGGLLPGWVGVSPEFQGIDLNFAWEGKGVGKTRLLHDDWLATHWGMKYVPREQGAVPSCVGQAAASAVDFLAAVEIHSLRQMERIPPARCSAAVVYGLSRQEIGNMGQGARGGSHVVWACEALRQYGAVASLNYRLSGIDLRAPSPLRCLEYGMKGCPDALEGIARLHRVAGYVRIVSWEQLRDAVATGHPVILDTGGVGFGSGKLTRDEDGFLNRPRWGKGRHWSHAVCVIGVCDTGRKGALVINSWGSEWVSGPKRFKNDPVGSFWIDAEIIDDMMILGNSYALRGFYGYPRRFTL